MNNIQQKILDRVVESFMSADASSEINRLKLRALHMAWGNLGFMASISYLDRVKQAVEWVDGPILECGSGLSTLLMAILTHKKGIPIYALENHSGWFERMNTTMARYGFDQVTIVQAPLRDFGEYDWYSFDKSILPSNIDLVICDGPPGNIKGSRYGLVPEVHEYLSNECRILLDDANRKNEKQVLENWKFRHGYEFKTAGLFQKFAVINRPSCAKA